MSSDPPPEAPGRRPKARPGPPSGKRAQNRRERERALRDAGVRLFLERGIEAVTVDDLARAAGMAKGNFYRYSQDKTDLVAAIMAEVGSEVRAALGACAEAVEQAHDPAVLTRAYEALAAALAAAMLGHLPAVRLYLQERRAPDVGARGPICRLAEEVEDGAIRLTEVAVDHGLLRVPDPRISALAVVGAVEELALAVVQGRLTAPPQEIGATLIHLVLSGLRG